MSFTKRRIALKFQLGEGAFGVDGSNTVELTGLRCTANITKAGGVSMSSLDLRVYGLPLEVMGKLTLLNQLLYTSARMNTITVSAGDDENGMAVCFTGIINEAWADARGAPDVMFHVAAHTGMIDSVKPVAPVSYNGSVDVATVMAGIAAQMQPVRTLENSGVTTRINSPYLAGTLRDQALTLARAAGCNMLIDDTVLAIWPLGGTRSGAVPEISAATGLVGYPEFTQSGVRLITLYNPSLTFGRTVQVKSSLEPANGNWVIAAVSHNLEAETPGGAWFTQIECGLLGHPTPVIG